MNNLAIFFTDPSILFIMKIVFLVAIFVYGIFSFVVLKQVKLMSSSFITRYGVLFRLFALIHFIAVVLIFIIALIVL